MKKRRKSDQNNSVGFYAAFLTLITIITIMRGWIFQLKLMKLLGLYIFFCYFLFMNSLHFYTATFFFKTFSRNFHSICVGIIMYRTVLEVQMYCWKEKKYRVESLLFIDEMNSSSVFRKVYKKNHIYLYRLNIRDRERGREKKQRENEKKKDFDVRQRKKLNTYETIFFNYSYLT